MEARKQVRAPVRVKRTKISVNTACCARTVAPLSDEGRGLKPECIYAVGELGRNGNTRPCC